MNYTRNIPDWQQYNALESGATDGAAASMAVAPVGQNANPNHSFVPSISPSSISNMNSECLNKSQNESNFGSRNYATSANGSNGCNMGQSPLTSMMHMSNCIGHYGNTSNVNPIIEDMNSDMEHHRNPIADEMMHRNNTLPPMNGSVNHMVGSNMNVNNNLVAGSRVPPNNSMPSNRQTPFIPGPCKGPCCISDPNIAYTYGSYPSGVPYRENMHISNYNPEERRYRGNISYRKEAYANKIVNTNNQYHMDQRRNYSDYKYRKDSTIPRNYHQSSVILPNYGMQNYNVSGDYVKYHHYPSRVGPPMTNPPNNPPGMIKFQDPSKHAQYQNNMMQSMVPNTNIPTSSMQNAYYNPQAGPREYPNENRDIIDPSNTRLPPPSGPHAKHQIYRQKFAIQRYTLENQLKEMTRIPGYLSNAKYQECVLRYRELLKLQRTVEFQSSMQESSMNTNINPNISSPISPINLQFDHNGILINSNYLPTNYPGICNQSLNQNPNIVAVEKTPHPPGSMPQQHNIQILEPATCASEQHKSSNVNQDHNGGTTAVQQRDFPVPQKIQQVNKVNKDFADKPDLDVRQFLANWDESEEEENAIANVTGKETTPITVVEFTDINLVTNINEAQKEFGILESNAAIEGDETVEINKVVSVVGCISSDGNQVPTIHIVDNLENKIVVEKIDNTLNGINNSNIKSIQELVNTEISTNNACQKQKQEVLPNSLSKTDQNSIQIPENRNTVTKSIKSNVDNLTSDKENITNVELNNPDDFSLPELSTYECTPLSTSLNTPTHSDNEESVEQVAHLRMSANPIEIVKNSPIISFTQPLDERNKNKTKSSHESLNFLVNSNEVMENFLATSKTNIADGIISKENKEGSVDQTLQKSNNNLDCEEDRQELLPQEWFSSTSIEYNNEKDTNKSDEIPVSLSLPTITNDDSSPILKLQVSKTDNKKSPKIVEDPNACDKIIQQFYADSSYSTSPNNPLAPSEKNGAQSNLLSPEEGSTSSKNIENVSIIHSDDEIINQDDNIWMDIANIDKHIDNISREKHIYTRERKLSAHKLKKLLKYNQKYKNIKDLKKLKHLFKNDLKKLQIEEKINSHCNSDLIKFAEDSSSSSQSSDNTIMSIISKPRKFKDIDKLNPRPDDKRKRDATWVNSTERLRRSRSVEPNVTNNDQSHLLREFKKLKRKRSIGNSADKHEIDKISLNNKSRPTEGPKEGDNLAFNDCLSEKCKETDNNLVKFDANKAKKEFGIQLANVNFRINDEDLRKSFLALKDEHKDGKETVDGIKIEINLSCSENKNSTVSKVLKCEDKIKSNNKNSNNINNNKEIILDEKDISTSQCDKSLSKPNKSIIENVSIKTNQNLNLPQIIGNDNICMSNEYLPRNFSECLTPMIIDNLNDKSSNENYSHKKKTNKTIDAMEVKDHLKILNKPLNFKFTDDHYNSKLFDCSKDPIHIYNMQNFKPPKLLTSLNIESLANPNIECLDPCSSTSQRYGEKRSTYSFDKTDALSFNVNPLTFKNYASEDTFESSLNGRDNGSPSGFFNPAFMDGIDKMNTVPIYTTKDGKIKYSPNRKYTYKMLLMESDKIHDSSSIYNHHYYSKSRDKKKHKSKVHDGKHHKSSKEHSHKHGVQKSETIVNESPVQKNEIEQIRDCSVIAIAPSNSSIDVKPTEEPLAIQDNQNELIQNEENDIKDTTFVEEHSFDSKHQVPLDISKLNEEIHNVDNENRSTVIKQLGVISQDHNELDISVESEECLSDNVKSVIRIDETSVKKNTNVFNPVHFEQETTSVLAHSSYVNILPLSVRLDNNVINKNDVPNIQQKAPLKDNPDKKIIRRNSTSVIERSAHHHTIKPRRKSFGCDVIVSSNLPRNNVYSPKKADNDKDVNCVLESTEESITKDVQSISNLDNTAQIPVIISKPCAVKIEESKELNLIPEIEINDQRTICISDEKNISTETDPKPFVDKKESIINHSSDVIDNDQKHNIPTNTVINQQPNFESYNDMCLQYENDVMNTEDDVENEENSILNIKHEVESKENSVLKLIDNSIVSEDSDELPPLEQPTLDNNSNINQSDNESVECPKLERQVEETTNDLFHSAVPEKEENNLRSVLMQNDFTKETTKLVHSPIHLVEDNFKSTSYVESIQPCLEKEKVIPKLVIRKSESLSKIVSQPKSPFIDNEDNIVKNDSESRPPKIPKMIIRNARSRPETPTIEEISVPYLRTSSAESKNNKLRVSKSDDRSKKNCSDDNKVPKMKINLENEVPKVVVENIQQKTVPKMKIKKVRSLVPLVAEEKDVISTSHRSRDSDDRKDNKEPRKSSRDKIPKLKIRKDANLVPTKSSEKRSRSHSSQQTPSKRPRQYSKDRPELANLSEYECNTNDLPSVSDKIPKVIIKRTSTKSEFKCELSKCKRKALEWQPRVTLNRSWILDTMAKEFRHMKVALKLTTPRNIDQLYTKNNIDPNKLKWDKFLSDLKKKNKLSKSSSEVISFDITTSTSRKRKHSLSNTKKYSESEYSDLNLTKNFDENMNSQDKDYVQSSSKRKKMEFSLANEKDEYASDDACFNNISTRKLKETIDNKSLVLCPVISTVNNDDSCTKMSTLSISQKIHFDGSNQNFIMSDINCRNDDNTRFHCLENNDMEVDSNMEDNFVIKLESSDESQTTIEILPASPDVSQDGIEIADRKSNNNYSQEITPKQEKLTFDFSNTEFKDVRKPKIKMYNDCVNDNAMDKNISQESKKTSKKCPSFKSSNCESNYNHSKSSSNHKSRRQSQKLNKDGLSYSDLLAKEVLAAKETLKRCFKKYRSEYSSVCNHKPKTIEEKLQFSFKRSDFNSSSDQICLNVNDNKQIQHLIKDENQKEGKDDRRRSKSRSRSRFDLEHQVINTTISLKRMKTVLKETEKSEPNNVEVTKKLVSSESTNRQFVNSFQKAMQVIEVMNQKDCNRELKDKMKLQEEKEKIIKEEYMPILEPQVNVNFETSPDRDTSRSPPVITTQDSLDTSPTSPKEELLKLNLYENENHTKVVKPKEESDMTIAEIVGELAFHDKATIKHRRYCTLCERWFSSVIRLERHLSGYQHRHMELVQRRTIHTLYTLFTGKPCPKLLPANITRKDCFPGEPTPLQIVVQDIVIDCDGMRSDKKKHENSNS